MSLLASAGQLIYFANKAYVKTEDNKKAFDAANQKFDIALLNFENKQNLFMEKKNAFEQSELRLNENLEKSSFMQKKQYELLKLYLSID